LDAPGTCCPGRVRRRGPDCLTTRSKRRSALDEEPTVFACHGGETAAGAS
jgi:hypothetical protein